MQKNIISSPLIGHGNPFAAEAINRLAEIEGRDTELIFQRTIPKLGNVAHQFRTSVPALAEQYTKDSSVREGFAAKLFGRLSFYELSIRAGDVDQDTTLHLTQEHVLLGTPQKVLQEKGFDTVRLLVPDVYPKQSGKAALAKHSGATAFVWNKGCYEELAEEGVAVELIKPFYLDAFKPEADETIGTGLPIVIKSSGSGMPQSWRSQLSQAMQAIDDMPWAIHHPDTVETSNQRMAAHGLQDNIRYFFNDIGVETRLIIGPPSELVGIVFDLNSRGIPVRLISFPPRGEHEYRNLATAMEHGLVLSELRFDTKPPTISGLDVIHCSDLADAVHQERITYPVDNGFLGNVPYWGL